MTAKSAKAGVKKGQEQKKDKPEPPVSWNDKGVEMTNPFRLSSHLKVDSKQVEKYIQTAGLKTLMEIPAGRGVMRIYEYGAALKAVQDGMAEQARKQEQKRIEAQRAEEKSGGAAGEAVELKKLIQAAVKESIAPLSERLEGMALQSGRLTLMSDELIKQREASGKALEQFKVEVNAKLKTIADAVAELAKSLTDSRGEVKAGLSSVEGKMKDLGDVVLDAMCAPQGSGKAAGGAVSDAGTAVAGAAVAQASVEAVPGASKAPVVQEAASVAPKDEKKRVIAVVGLINGQKRQIEDEFGNARDVEIHFFEAGDSKKHSTEAAFDRCDAIFSVPGQMTKQMDDLLRKFGGKVKRQQSPNNSGLIRGMRTFLGNGGAHAS